MSKKKSAQATMEYVIVVVIIIAAVVAGAVALGPKITSSYNRAGIKMESRMGNIMNLD